MLGIVNAEDDMKHTRSIEIKSRKAVYDRPCCCQAFIDIIIRLLAFFHRVVTQIDRSDVIVIILT